MLIDCKFHHIGMAVFDIEKTAPYYMEGGYSRTETIIDPIQNVKICFLHKEGMPLLELLAPINNESPVNRILENMGVQPYHCCYEVPNIDEAIIYLKRKGFLLLGKPVVACAMEGKQICFLFNKSVGLIELLEL